MLTGGPRPGGREGVAVGKVSSMADEEFRVEVVLGNDEHRLTFWDRLRALDLDDDAFMYDSIYFLRDRPGIALHGSRVNSLIKPYPASHRCVRVLRPEIHEIFADTPIGTKVQVYGEY
jgi:lipoprotein-anchoring transpeptidase ErfK/SrfK